MVEYQILHTPQIGVHTDGVHYDGSWPMLDEQDSAASSFRYLNKAVYFSEKNMTNLDLLITCFNGQAEKDLGLRACRNFLGQHH